MQFDGQFERLAGGSQRQRGPMNAGGRFVRDIDFAKQTAAALAGNAVVGRGNGNGIGQRNDWIGEQALLSYRHFEARRNWRSATICRFIVAKFNSGTTPGAVPRIRI